MPLSSIVTSTTFPLSRGAGGTGVPGAGRRARRRRLRGDDRDAGARNGNHESEACGEPDRE